MSKVYEIATQKILEAMDKGTLPWRKPWSGTDSKPFNGATGRAYSGGNFFLLGMLGYSVPAFVTFNQIKAANATIKDGQEKTHFPVFYWKLLERENDKGIKETFPMLRYFLVWNVEQLDGFDSAKLREFNDAAMQYDHDPIESAENIVAGYADAPKMVIEASDRAFYHPTLDEIHAPKMEQYEKVQEYYAVLFHEMGHSTGHKTRLNRKEINEPAYFGSHEYSLEELVAELTASFLCAESGIDNTIDNSAAYIKGWHEKLSNDPKLFWTAAGRAQKAADYILGRKRGD